MKTVIRRHVRAYHVFRALRIAQAVALATKDEVFIECFQEHKNILELTPSVKWKDPRHPFEVAERDADNPKFHRPGGKLYDHVIDIDSDGPFEARWMAAGGSFWEWVSSIVARRDAKLGAELIAGPWPAIEIELPKPKDLPGEFILIAPLSQESEPIEINANALSEWAAKAFPGIPQLWTTFGRNFGAGRAPAPFANLPELAAVIRAAKAVVTVKGIVAGLSQSVYQAARLAKILVLVTDRAAPPPPVANQIPNRPKFKPPPRRSALMRPGPLLDLGEAAGAVRALPDKTGILEPQIDGSLKELTPHPAD